jgi:hypothetical protein
MLSWMLLRLLLREFVEFSLDRTGVGTGAAPSLYVTSTLAAV